MPGFTSYAPIQSGADAHTGSPLPLPRLTAKLTGGLGVKGCVANVLQCIPRLQPVGHLLAGFPYYRQYFQVSANPTAYPSTLHPPPFLEALATFAPLLVRYYCSANSAFDFQAPQLSKRIEPTLCQLLPGLALSHEIQHEAQCPAN